MAAHVMELRSDDRCVRSSERADGCEPPDGGLDLDLPGAVMLHGRRVPGTNGTIDQLVITAAGVFVIDANDRSGRVECRDTGTFRQQDDRLYVGGIDRTELVAGMDWQTKAVWRVLDAMGFGAAPIRSVLCFTDVAWGLMARPFTIHGVLIGQPPVIEHLIANALPILGDDAVHAIATELSARLPASRPTATAR